MIDPLSVFLLLISASTPILFAALGELVVERAGVLNLGVEGMMITGALAGFAAAYASGNPFLGFLVAAVAGAAISLLFAALTQLFLAALAIRQARGDLIEAVFLIRREEGVFLETMRVGDNLVDDEGSNNLTDANTVGAQATGPPG